MTQFEQMVYDTVRDIQEIKRGNRQFPDYALTTEIQNSINVDILEALRTLYRNGYIKHHKTVNKADMFGIKQKKISDS